MKAARVHHAARRRGGGVAAGGMRAAAGDAGDRVSLPGSPDTSHIRAAFRKGLSETGYVEGHNVAIEYRWATMQNDRLPALAADLVRRRVAVIATPGSTCGTGGQSGDHDNPDRLPSARDPVQLGLVASLNRPGGNLTGFSYHERGARGQSGSGSCTSCVPGAARFAVLVNPNNPLTSSHYEDVRGGGVGHLGGKSKSSRASTSREIDAAFQAWRKSRPTRSSSVADEFFTPSRSARHAGDAPRGARDLFGRASMPRPAG